MTATIEQKLRSALDLMLSSDRPFLRTMLAQFEELEFVSDDTVLGCPALRATQKEGSGVLWVHLSPSQKVLVIAALFDGGFTTTTTCRLPREYWTKTEREVEQRVERMIGHLDRLLANRDMSEDDYHKALNDLSEWEESERLKGQAQ